MLRRRLPTVAFASAALAAVSLACQPSIPNQAPPATVAFAVSFPTCSDGTQTFQPPLPNDLVLQAVTTPPAAAQCQPTAAAPSAAQLKLLQELARSGGWPNDQEVPIQVQFFAVAPDKNGGTPGAAAFPDLDTSTITPSSLAIVRYDSGTPTAVPFEIGGYDATTGVLTVRKATDQATGTRWWPTGPGGARYAVALRGGTDGVKTKTGGLIAAQTSTLLLTQDKDLTLPENQSLLKGQPAGTAQQLEALRQLYVTPRAWQFVGGAQGWAPAPAASGISAFSAIDSVFPHGEAASLQTFVVDPSAHVAIDPTAGVVPLPSEFLMNAAPPGSYFTAAGGSPLASHVNVPAVGALAQLAPGLNTLDGFSTTAMLLVPTAGTPVAAASVTAGSVILLEKQGANWVKVPDFTATQPTGKYLTLPPPITADPANNGQPCATPYNATCVAKLIGLQPAVGVPLPDGSIVPLPPLKEHTEYGVIVTSDVKDVAGKPITAGTLAKILTIATDPATPVSVGGKSQLAGVSDASAAQLQGLAPLIANELKTDLVPGAAATGVDPAKVVTAYTFPTQSISSTANQLVAASANPALPQALVGVSALIAPDVTAKKYGFPTTPLRDPAPPNAFIPAGFLEATLVTLDVLDPATGAFRANPATAVPSQIPVLIAVPQARLVPVAGAPVVIFRHGLGRGRADMLSLAGTFTGAGMVVAAIDADKFGDRAWCSSDADCASGGTCDTSKFGNQGDATKPGLCSNGKLLESPVKSGLPACSATVTTECWDGTGGIAKASGNFFVSGNLFRLRDSMRQDIVDQAALARTITNAGTSLGVTIDPTKVFFVGQSLGAISGTVDVAVNPAFQAAVLNAGGGTFADIAVDSPSLAPLLNSVLAAEGIQPGTSSFLQFIQVAKWVIDPADPVNFAATLVANGTPVLGQAARCDNTVPNKENQLLYGLLGKSPTNPVASANNPKLQWYMQDATTACPTDGTTGKGATHGFLLDFANQSLTLKAQSSAATFLLGSPSATTPVLP